MSQSDPTIQTDQQSDPRPQGFGLAHIAALRHVSDIAIAPDGRRAAFVLKVPRDLSREADGPAWAELHVTGPEQQPARAYIAGQENVSAPRFTPDGRFIAFLARRGKDREIAIWTVPVDGGEARRTAVYATSIRDFRIAPTGKQVAFLAPQAASKARLEARKKGFNQEVFEEDWLPTRLCIQAFDPRSSVSSTAQGKRSEARTLTLAGSVFDLRWSHDSRHLAIALAPRPLVDDRYMEKRVHLIEVARGKPVMRFANPGKLGAFELAPDGRHLAMISACDRRDPKQGRLFVAPVSGARADTGVLRDVLPDLDGHITSIAWASPDSLVYVADIGVETELGTVDLAGRRTPLLDAGHDGLPIIRDLALAQDGQQAVLRGERPDHPPELYTLRLGEAPVRRSEVNPWLRGLKLAPQRPERWHARDGLELEGILIEPHRPAGAQRVPKPLVLIVHGGPESHIRNGWSTTYSSPGQLLAAHGYVVFFPNYRGSTGRGVAFSMRGQGDAAGAEFDDLVDAVDHLVAAGWVDPERVGVTGASYGGYATAWLCTRHSERFHAGVMFNGISNKTSKALTTDIPKEDRAVHAHHDPWERAVHALERSPIHHLANARTPLLIAHGSADTRVHPAQSLQLFRALKLLGQAPVRMVRYPDEGHGNRRQATREDYTARLLRWLQHFLRNGATELPHWDIPHPVEKP